MTNKELIEKFRKSKFANFMKFLDWYYKREAQNESSTTD